MLDKIKKIDELIKKINFNDKLKKSNIASINYNKKLIIGFEKEIKDLEDKILKLKNENIRCEKKIEDLEIKTEQITTELKKYIK